MKIDGIHYYSPEHDSSFTTVADKIERCPHLKIYHTCQRCPHFNRCDELFSQLSGRAVRHGNLKPDDINYFRQRFLNKVGIAL